MSMVSYQLPWMSLVIPVLVFFTLLSKAADQELDCLHTYRCFDCETWNDNDTCADPFTNLSSISVPEVKCVGGYCVKWFRDFGNGLHYYRRTCSQNMTTTDLKSTFMNVSIVMPVALVCFPEGRPASGSLCFCNHDKCNAGSPFASQHFWPIALVTFCCSWLLILMQNKGPSRA